MPVARFHMPDGRVARFEVPEGTTPEQAQGMMEEHFASPAAQPAAKPQGFIDKALALNREAGQGIVNAGAGAIRGAGSIGATILAPYDMAKDALAGKGLSLESNRQRRAEIDEGLQTMGADTDSLTYQGGKLGAEVAGTLGVGNVLSGGARALNAAPALVNAIRTAGMSTGAKQTAMANALTRAAGGAVTGGASAGLVDPEYAGTGAAVGAALPPVLMGMGKAGIGIANVWRKMKSSGDEAGAESLLKALSAATPEEKLALVEKLRSAETLVPGASPTVAQALQTPQAGILNRVVYDSPNGGALRDKVMAQNLARNNALEAVSPTDVNGFVSAQDDMGNAISRRVIPEENAIRQSAGAMYDKIDPNNAARIIPPVQAMQKATEKYVGAGAVGQGGVARQFLGEAQNLSAEGKMASWQEIQRMRSTLGEAIQTAKKVGNRQESAALTGQLKALDDHISTLTTDFQPAGRMPNGQFSKPEKFTPEMQAAWKESNLSWKAFQEKYHTGPQASIFRKGADGLPLVEGKQVAQKFWGTAEDVKSFRKLVDDNPAMLGQFKSMVTTQGADTGNAAGELTTKFSKWVKQSLPKLRETFSPDEFQKLQNIAADIDRNAAAMKAGTSLGGSNTYQNAANALDLGMLDSQALTKAATVVPYLRGLASPALEGIRGAARSTKAKNMAELLADSNVAADAIQKLIKSGVPPAKANKLMADLLKQGAMRAAPVAAVGLQE